MKFIIVLDLLKFDVVVKGLVAELAPPHAQSAWGSRGERIRAAGLAVYYNYFSKKKFVTSSIVVQTNFFSVSLLIVF